MNTCDCEGKQISLAYKDAEELAYRAQEGNTDSLVLLLEGIKEKLRDSDVDLLIHTAVVAVIHLCSAYDDLKEDCIRILLRKFRQKSGGT